MNLRCNQCHTPIPDDTYVVNWGSCDACFDHGYLMYLQDGCDPCDEWPFEWDDGDGSIDDLFD